MIRSDQMDRRFIEEVMAEPGGEHLLTCWSCGTCAATCLVRRFNPAFNPRLILHKAGLGLREAVLSSAEIWACSACDACYPRCPQGIHISQVMRAIRNVAIRAGYEAPGPIAQVDANRCSGCAVCTRICPYEAIERASQNIDGQERVIARVDRNLCQACGLCVAACPSGAMSLEALNDAELLTRMAAGGWLEHAGFLQGASITPRLLAFVCQWSVRAEDEWQRIQALNDEHLRVVILPCSGRVEPAHILLALSKGVDGVLVMGCHEGECHYQRGTYLGRGKVALLNEMMAQMGIARERVRFVESSALERRIFEERLALMREAILALRPALEIPAR